MTPHGQLRPSPWIERFASRLPAGAAVLDLACGSGRHTRWLAQRDLKVTAVDRDHEALESLRGIAHEIIEADIENGPWPLADRQFDLIVVTNYLWRPLFDRTIDALAPGGWWLHETFAIGNETVGKPSRPDFLLKPGELLEIAQGHRLRTVAYEDGFLDEPPRFVQRIAAVRDADSAVPPRHSIG